MAVYITWRGQLWHSVLSWTDRRFRTYCGRKRRAADATISKSPDGVLCPRCLKKTEANA